MSDALTGVRKSLNKILAIRDKVAVIHAVFQVTRRWTGSEIGEGIFQDDKMRILPTPGIKEYGHDVRLNEAGAIQQGDIILKGISKVNYPTEKDLDCSSPDADTEKFWLIDDKEYVTVNIKESYLTWDVQLRKRIGNAR